MQKFWGCMAMIIATVIWGFAFSAQSSGMRFIGPVLFVAVRSIVGVFALILVCMVFDLFREKRLSIRGSAKTKEEQKFLLYGGLYCGLALSAASICQQWGLKYITAGKTGFLTALYIVIVPIIGIFFKRKTSPVLWIAVILALCGSYLLCGSIDGIGAGELLVIACAFLYSIHILVIDHYAPHCDCIRLSCIQFTVASVLCSGASVLAGEQWIWQDIMRSMPFWLFCGVGSSALAFTLQMVCQKYVHPVTASLLMSLESVFAVLGGWLFLQEKLSAMELAGCCVIMIAILLSQIPFPVKRKQENAALTVPDPQ